MKIHFWLKITEFSLLGLITFFWLINRNLEQKKSSYRYSENRPKLESFYRHQSEYDSAFKDVSLEAKSQIVAGIITHHFLANKLIANFFSGIRSEKIKNVIVIGPDHFQSLATTQSDLVISNLDWQTPFGILTTNQSVINQWQNNLGAQVNDSIFKTEHSIFTLVPFIKKVFPEAQIIPLVLKTSSDAQKFFALGQSAYREDSILIASIDFSHHVTAPVAHQNDGQSINYLQSAELANIHSIECDCESCLAFLFGFISRRPTNFKLMANQTSADFGSQESDDLTSYISGYYLPVN